MPDAREAFNARRAWRGWSEVDPNVHYAVCELEDVADARAISGSDVLAGLAAELDRLQGERVTGTREIVSAIQAIGSRGRR